MRLRTFIMFMGAEKIMMVNSQLSLLNSCIDKKKIKNYKLLNLGLNTRNFTHIDDTIAALKLIADKGYGDEYGIANQKKYSITQVAKLISDQIEYVRTKLIGWLLNWLQRKYLN